MCSTDEQAPAPASSGEAIYSAGGPSTAAQALACARAGLSFLASVDAAGLTGAERADLLRGLCQAESQHLAARSAVLAGFDRAGNHAGDAQASAKSWLVWQARVTRAAAGAAMAWAQRLQAHPRIAAALAAGRVSPSWARHLADWTDRLPEDARDKGDTILLDAAAGGADLSGLAALAEELRRRAAGPDTDRRRGGSPTAGCADPPFPGQRPPGR